MPLHARVLESLVPLLRQLQSPACAHLLLFAVCLGSPSVLLHLLLSVCLCVLIHQQLLSLAALLCLWPLPCSRPSLLIVLPYGYLTTSGPAPTMDDVEKADAFAMDAFQMSEDYASRWICAAQSTASGDR